MMLNIAHSIVQCGQSQYVSSMRGTYQTFNLVVYSAATGKVITSVSEATAQDVDLAVEAAQKAFDTVWGLKASGSKRSNLLWKLADAMERHKEELAALEALNNGDMTVRFVQQTINRS
jgi:aldehyde dehydrogenase (NAD+)